MNPAASSRRPGAPNDRSLVGRARWLGLRIVVSVVALVAVLLVAEVALRVWMSATGNPFDPDDTKRRIDAAVDLTSAYTPPKRADGGGGENDGSRGARDISSNVLHPYFGSEREHDTGGVLEYFRTRPERDAYVVVIVGGSVAAGYASDVDRSGRHALVEHIVESGLTAKLGLPEGSEVEVLNYAHAAFKQPQQVMRMAYLFSLGYTPDLVLNIDGYNEVNGAAFNASRDVHPVYPSPTVWGLWLTARDDEESILSRAQLVQYASEKRRLGHLADAYSVHRSSLASALLQRHLRGINRAGARVQAVLSRPRADNEIEFRQTHGPDFDTSDAAVRAAAVENWFESSRSLSAMCRARDVEYVHVLQPTLDLDDSKPLTAEERAIRSATERSPHVDPGIRALRRLGAQLRADGEHFFDATELFVDEERTAYVDPVHFNGVGRAALRSFVEDAVTSVLSSE